MDLFAQRFRLAMEFAAALAHRFGRLRMELGESVLKFSGKLFEALIRFSRMRQ